MRRVGPTLRRGGALIAALLAFGAIAVTPGHARAELGGDLDGDGEVEEGSDSSLGEFGLPDWIPSIGVGFGIQSRKGEGRFDGMIKSDAFRNTPLSGATLFNCRPLFIFGLPNTLRGTCDFVQDSEESIDGGTVPGSIQLLGPSYDGLPFGLAVRPFLQGGAAWTFDRRLIARQGFLVADFALGNALEADVRAEIEGEPRYFWYTGLGAALQLPIERPTFLKIAANYHEQRVNVFGRVDRGFVVNGEIVDFRRLEQEDELTIKGLGPSIGIESEIARIGPVAIGFAADLLVSFPISGTDSVYTRTQTTLLSDAELATAPICAPGQEPSFLNFCYDNIDFDISLDNPFYFGGVQIRFSWIGW